MTKTFSEFEQDLYEALLTNDVENQARAIRDLPDAEFWRVLAKLERVVKIFRNPIYSLSEYD